MKLRDWFLVVFTFLIGVLCGLYLYVTAFQPTYQSGNNDGSTEIADFNVIGFAYGTADPESSFRIREDGSYSYIPDESNIAERESGQIPERLLRTISNAIKNTDSAVVSAPVDRTDCDSAVDQGDFEYDIEYEGESFVVDTCATNFSKDSELAKALLLAWQYMANPDDEAAIEFSVSNSPGGVDTSDRESGSRWTLRGYFERGFQDSGLSE